ncbi:MAG TPA: hypothetical protein VIF09_14450 [Polyangiaceae bacterium]|jgi:hypothetical protein
MRSLRAAAVVASLFLAGAGCSTLLGDFSLTGGGDGGSEGESGTEGGGADVTNGESGGADSGDATMGKDVSTGDGPGGGDGGDSSTSESGTSDASDGGGIVSCAIAAGFERMLNAAGATIAGDNLRVYNASQTSVLTLVQTSQGASPAYFVRSDRPTDTPQFVAMSGPGGVAHYMSSTRSVAGTGTYVLAEDAANNLLLYDWLDSAGIGAPPTTFTQTNLDLANMVATAGGIFWEFGVNGQTYVDWEVPPTGFSLATAGAAISPTDQNIRDGQHLYRLSDDTVSVLFTEADGVHQGHYGPGSASLIGSRLYYTGGIIQYGFAPDGTNTDVASILATNDAGAYGLFTARVPESQLFTFDVTSTMRQIPLSVPVGPQTCGTSWAGKFLALNPSTAGMDLYVFDMPTATIDYSLTGASNVLHADTAIVGCAVVLEASSSTATQLKFDLVWTDNAGGGPQNVMLAPLICTLQ